ncbi:hypothetical protein WA026_011044 [Henosepilachna vigintioctopunctata]|uniref:Odorant receptor n=1 Tax=Henosepilachna vigintioctopunctata TaxID=420089 RepID=A0AAW1U5K3_9CUCU
MSLAFETFNAYMEGIQKFGVNLGGLCSMGVVLIKLGIFKTNKYQSFVSYIFQNERCMNNSNIPELKQYYIHETNKTLKVVKSFKYCMILFIIVCSLLSISFIVKYEVFDYSEKDMFKPLYMPMKMPFDPIEHYILTNILFMATSPGIGVITMAVDFVELCPTIYLVHRMKNLNYVLENMERFVRYYNFKSQDVHSNIVIQCIREHQVIISEVHLCNSSLKNILLLDFLFHSSKIAFFASAFIGNESLLVMENMMAFAAFSYVFTQLFIIYWYGQILGEESEKIVTSIYLSNWYTLNSKSKHFLRIMMMRSQKPLGLTIGPFRMVSLRIFLQVVKTVYSTIMFLLRK